jgi:endo-1,3-1,4-beta-glycanase ExoK
MRHSSSQRTCGAEIRSTWASRGAFPSLRWRSAAHARWVFAAVAAFAYLGSASTARAVTSAEFYTPDSEGYGRFEARIMMPSGDGVVGAFFLWKDGSEATGAYWNELDFEKIDANCTLQINSIYGAPSVQHTQIVSGFNNLCSAYHTYAYEWTPDHIAWSIDGQEIRRDTGAGAQAYANNALSKGLQFRFNIWPGNSNFGGTFSSSILPVHEYISWVQYSTYTAGSGNAPATFPLAWRESFEQGVPASWAAGNWASPFGLSTNAPGNVTVVNGVAVLSLTADNMPGFSGNPPADSGDLPSVLPSTGPADASAVTSGSDSGSTASDAGSSGGGGSTGNTRDSGGGGTSGGGGGPATSGSGPGSGAAGSSGAGSGGSMGGVATGVGATTNAPGSAGGATNSDAGSNGKGCASSPSGVGGTALPVGAAIALAVARRRRRRK